MIQPPLDLTSLMPPRRSASSPPAPSTENVIPEPTGRITVPDLLALQARHWPEASGVAHQLALLTSRIAETSHQLFASAASRHGLRLSEFDVLATLRRFPAPHEATPGNLQRSLLISSGGLTKVLDHLEAKALVARTVNPEDGRGRRVSLTAAGQRTVEAAMAEGLASQKAWLDAALPAARARSLVNLLSEWSAQLPADG